MTPALEIRGLCKSFPAGKGRSVRAVHQLELAIGPGQIVAFIGPNGAGKTTTIHMTLGLLNPDAGTVRVFGLDPARAAARRAIGYQSEIFYTHTFMTARQALTYYGRLMGAKPAELAPEVPRILERIGLGGAVDRKVGTFSKGMVQRLGLAQALIHRPDMLILDEPTTGLDPEGRKLVADLILEEKARGATVFLSSHILSDVERTCDHVVMISGGELKFSQAIDRANRNSNAWEIDVSGWRSEFTAALSAAGFEPPADSGDRVRLVCADSRKRDLLKWLTARPVDITGLRPRLPSLEELYMKHVGTRSDGTRSDD